MWEKISCWIFKTAEGTETQNTKCIAKVRVMTTTTSKPTKEESLLPPKVIAGLTMFASGMSFDEAAECVGI